MAKPDVKSSDRSDVKIAAAHIHRLRLPYKAAISFKSLRQAAGEYVVLRLVASNGVEGIAESVCRPEFSGEDSESVAYQIRSFFEPHIVGADPLGHLAILKKLNRVPGCSAAKSLIDLALWDLRGKILGEPVWRLLGGETPEPVPLTWIAHGNNVDAQFEECRKMAETRGYRGMKLKTWRGNMDDVALVERVRAKLDPKLVVYVDGNGTYTESQARAVFPKMADYDVSFIEDPCTLADPSRLARLQSALPIAILGDQGCEDLYRAHLLIHAGAVGGVNVKLRRSGFTESLKIIALCEGAEIPVVIGTDSESRVSAMPRAHFRSAIPWLAPWPTETHFFDKLADDCFVGDFNFKDGCLLVDDSPGFGAALDPRKLAQYSI